MSTKWRIITGFVVMIAVTGVVAAIGYFGLSNATEAFNNYGRMSRLTVDTSYMAARQLSAIAEMRLFLINADPGTMKNARDEMRALQSIVTDSKTYVHSKDVQDILDALDGQIAQQMQGSEALEKSIVSTVRRYEEKVQPVLRRMNGELAALIHSSFLSNNEKGIRTRVAALEHLSVVRAVLSRFAYNRTQENVDRATEVLADLDKNFEAVLRTVISERGREGFARLLKSYDTMLEPINVMREEIRTGMELTRRIAELNHAILKSITKVSDEANLRMTEQGARTVRVHETAHKFGLAAAVIGLFGGILLAAFIIAGMIRALRSLEYDIVKYKLASRALDLAHWDMKIVDDALLDPINPINLNNTFVWSPELRRMCGFSELVDVPDILANWADRLHPDEREQVLRSFAAHIADRTGKTPFNLEHRIRTNNGGYRYVHAFGTTLRNKAGMPVRMAGAVEDITERVQIRDGLRDAEERIQVMLDASPFSLTMWDRNHNLIDCSRSAVRLFGFSGKQDLFERQATCLPEYQPNGRRSLEMLAEEMNRTFETGNNRLEWTQILASGEPGIFDLSCVRVKYKDDYAVLIYARDLRDDKEMLAELARRDEKLTVQAHWYKSLLDAIPLPLRVTDADMNLTFVNTASEKLFGKTREELLGKPCSYWAISLCGTDDCCATRTKHGLKQTLFTQNGVSYKVDSETLHDLSGDSSGFIEILHDVTDVEKAARQQADEANEAKNVFLATISHEMRTPLNAVIGLSELTLDGGGLNEEVEANIEKIYAAGSTLLSIVNDILDLSKIKSGKFAIIPNTYDVPSMVNDAIAQNLLRIGSKPIRFVLDIDENMPSHLYGDDLRIKQIMANLLSNAFKYTEKGTVELALSHARENESVWLTIRVSDTGVGIRPEDQARLFDDYSQVDAKANRKAGGTGLGLSITKSLAELMGGDVLVTSAYGQGSVFTASIRQGFVDDEVIGAELAANLQNFRYATLKRIRIARQNSIWLPYARVLVVDDHLTNLDVAKGIMRPYGMQIDCATSGQEAINIIREEKVRYNAVFMDHMMPEMDGVEAVRLIREIGTEYAGHIPIIALTANAVAGSEEMFLHNGFTAFISKPIDLTRLDEVLRRFVRDKAQEDLLDQGERDMRQGRDRRKGKDRRVGQDRRVSDRRDDAGRLPPDKEIDGLDIAEGLKRFGGEEPYAQVLRSYAVNTKPLLASIETVDRENLHGYAITAHGIKGSSRGICAEVVGSLAEALEYAAKSGDFDFVRDNNPAFLESVRGLVDRIETLLNGMTENNYRPKKDKPDSALLAKLKIACDSYELEGIDAVMREIDEYEYTADEGFAEWLRDNIAQLNYARITEKISRL